MSLEEGRVCGKKRGQQDSGKAKCSEDTSVRRPAYGEYCVATRTWSVRKKWVSPAQKAGICTLFCVVNSCPCGQEFFCN